jgi:hypothetical protein
MNKLFLILFLLASCATINDNINTMPEEDFNLLCQENYLLAKIGSKKICEQSKIFKEKALQLKEMYENVGQADPTNFVNEFINQWILNIDDEDIQLALQLVMVRLYRMGIIQSAELNQLSPRAVKVIDCVIEGIIDGAQY